MSERCLLINPLGNRQGGNPNNELIKHAAVPKGFQRNGSGLIVPNALSVLKSTELEIRDINTLKQHEEAQRQEEQKESRIEHLFEQYKIGPEIFNIPEQFAFMDRVIKALFASAGLVLPNLSGDKIRELIFATHKAAGNLELVKSIKLGLDTKAVAQLWHATYRFYRDFRDEFNAHADKRDFLLRLLHIFLKFSRYELKDEYNLLDCSPIIRFAIQVLNDSQNKSVAYIFAKAILKAHINLISQEQAEMTLRTLAKKKDLHTDLFYLLIHQHPDLYDKLKLGNLVDKRLWDKSSNELISRLDLYLPFACSDVPQRTTVPESNIGIEFEFLKFGDPNMVPDSIAGYMKKEKDFFSGKGHEDGDMTEVKTVNRGIKFDDRALQVLLNFAVVCELEPEYIGLYNVHLNMDKLAEEESIFYFRKREGNRMETNELMPPLPSAHVLEIHEYSIFIDQAIIVDALYGIDVDEIETFIRRKKLRESPKEAFMDRYRLEAEFLLDLSKKIARTDLIPRILRLYTRKAIPITELHKKSLALFGSSKAVQLDMLRSYDREFFLEFTKANKVNTNISIELASRVENFSLNDPENKKYLLELVRVNQDAAKALATQAENFSLNDPENKRYLLKFARFDYWVAVTLATQAENFSLNDPENKKYLLELARANRGAATSLAYRAEKFTLNSQENRDFFLELARENVYVATSLIPKITDFAPKSAENAEFLSEVYQISFHLAESLRSQT